MFPKEIHVFSVMTHSLWLQWRRSETKRTIRSSSPAYHSRTKETDGEGQKSSKRTVNKEESSSDWKCEIPFEFCQKNTSCEFCHPAVCQNYKSEKKDVYMTTNVMSDMLRQEESPTRSQRKEMQKDQLRYWRSLCNWVACLKILIRESLFCVNNENWDQNTSSNSPRTRDIKKKSGNKGSIARNYPKVYVSWV